MTDPRERLIDTAARAIEDAYPKTSTVRELAEAVIDALQISPFNFVPGYGATKPQGVNYVNGLFRIACLEAPAIQTHDSKEA